MVDTNVDFTLIEQAIKKQATNRFITGSESAIPLNLLGDIVAGWDDADRRAIIVLRALISLTRANPDTTQGFTSTEIVEVVREEHIHGWASGESGNDPDYFSKRIRKYWKELDAIWPTRIDGIRQRFSDEKIPYIPRIEVTPGGGRSHPTRYKITFNTNSALKVMQDSQPTGKAEVIRYYMEEITDAPVIGKLLRNGYALKHWRGAVFLGLMVIILLVIISSILLTSYAIIQAQTLLSLITSLLISGMAIGGLWLMFKPLYRLPLDRIVVAPWWLMGLSKYDDRLLTIRESTSQQANVIYMARYVSTCPICGGKVRAQAGGREFNERIVGRCENTPREHVFSFDHVTRNGHKLRD